MRNQSFVVSLIFMLIIAMPAWCIDLNPGKFEITTSVEMQGVPAEMVGSMPARTMTQCITEQNPLPSSSSGSQGCVLKDMQTEGSTITYKMECEQQGMKSESFGEMTYKGDSLAGTTQTKMGPSSGGVTVLTRIAGKRIGECDTSDSPPEIATDDTSITMSEDQEGADNESDDEADACAAARFRIRPTHTFNWSPGRATDQFLVNGNTTMGAVCHVGTGTTEDNPRQCRIPYSNSGHIQTNTGRCDVSGQSQALLEVVASCSKGNYILDITEYQDPDAGLGAEMDCPQIPMTQPHPTYYPGTISRITFPTSQQTHTAKELGPDVSGSFEYAKSWEITAIEEAPCEDIKMLQLYMEAAQKRAELYKELLPQAKNADHLDQLVKNAMIEDQAEANNFSHIDDMPITAGDYDPCTTGGIINKYSACEIKNIYGEKLINPPLCDWIDQGTVAHEKRHRSDAQSDDDSRRKYCTTSGKDQARIASEWEANAYGATVEVYQEILDALRDLFPECFE